MPFGPQTVPDLPASTLQVQVAVLSSGIDERLSASRLAVQGQNPYEHLCRPMVLPFYWACLVGRFASASVGAPVRPRSRLQRGEPRPLPRFS